MNRKPLSQRKFHILCNDDQIVYDLTVLILLAHILIKNNLIAHHVLNVKNVSIVYVNDKMRLGPSKK